eukprot:NODE_184_length_2090_cov_947.391965_g145_i0.p1 GENE.NODE_184_length_2090_cov_947.391965_g145_i0~~NODE_184_length_2090_cov_947.391965_g145_i0.p1  ORF type:complete len:591 (+),score=160.45 NODE_184_length_2090_cov_947.391965_g145_i0:249-2021(+)
MEFETPAAAERAKDKLNNTKLGTFKIQVSLATDFARYATVPETYTEPTVKNVPNLQTWLLDPSARDQYMVLYGETLECWWNDPISLEKQTLEKKKVGWTDEIAWWSPLGTYLATLHKQGIQLWGGAEWESLGRFPHASAQLIDFSPGEKFVVTWYNNMTLWDVATGKNLKVFPGGPTAAHGWPVFKWSGDEKYFARITEDNIHIFDSSTRTLIQPDPKKATTLYIPGVKSFDWSPTDNIISYWVPEENEKPARVDLVKVVMNKRGNFEIQHVTRKNLYRVVDIRMHWQSAGEFLCVKVDRHKKSASSKERVTSFELFRLRSKADAIPVDVVELKEEVVAFAWEPKGLRFAVIHGDAPSKYSVSFYTMGHEKPGLPAQVKRLASLPKKSANHLFWSPRGNHIVLAGFGSFNGNLEFWNVNEMEITGSGEHFMCTDVEWDPSGRYVASSVSYYHHQLENGYTLWTFQGNQVLSFSREKFKKFSWRPRPAALLTDNRLKSIQKSLKEKSIVYEEQERKMAKVEEEAINRRKREAKEKFQARLRERRADMKPLTVRRRQQRKNCGWASDDESCFKVVEEFVEEVLEIEEEELPA